MSSHSFYIAYDGPALVANEMDVRELAPALLALSDAFNEANAVLNRERANIQLSVKGSFKSGCFGIDLVVGQKFLDSLLNIGAEDTVNTAKEIAGLLGFSVWGTTAGVIKVIKWSRGRKVTKIESSNGKAKLYVGDKFIETEEKVLKLLRNDKIRRAMEDAIKKPLENEGITSFGCASRSGEEIFEAVNKEDAEFFAAPSSESEDLGESVYETTLQLLSPSFQDSNKWRFSDGGSNTFYADMCDSSFNAKVDSHAILFGKGDIIRAKIKEKKTLDSKGIMKVDRAIVAVLEHRNAIVQINIME